jgi:membrane peptidoglycan carboxypeptidase
MDRQRGLLLGLVLGASAVFLLPLLILGIAYFHYSHGLKSPQESVGTGTSIAYDREGRQLHRYTDSGEGLREPVPLDEISPYLVAATIATEDASFYDNPGVNVRGLIRAGWENLTPFGNGFLSGSGGSSITQQLVKNVYVSPSDRTSTDPFTRANRKLKETVVALELKRKYSDDEILTWYLNGIYYGNFAYGIQAASRQYFGKTAADLTLAEAAYLAGFPQAPSTYAADAEAAAQRQEQVLDLMIKNLGNVNSIPGEAGQPMLKLTEQEIEAARAEKVKFVNKKLEAKAPHWDFYVQEQVTSMCHAGQFDPPGDLPCDRVVANGSLKIRTTLDLGLNQIAEKTIDEVLSANEELTGGHNGALVAIDPRTGQILAYVGSRDYHNEKIQGEVDIASSPRSMGSTMKVFTYLTAFDQGWVPSSYAVDRPLTLGEGGDLVSINNWNGSYLGQITLRSALSQSVNTTAVRLVNEVSVDEMRKTAHKIGVTGLRDGDCGPAITLGACEVKLVDQAYAFSTLANNGKMVGRPSSLDLPGDFRPLDPVAVLEIKDVDGDVIYKHDSPEGEQVADPASAYMITDILSRDAASWSRLDIGRPAAVKTGTSEQFRDGVVMGYTPDLAAGVWMGNADNTPMAEGTFSAQGAGPIWTQFMRAALGYLGIPPSQFEVPDGIVQVPCAGKTEIFKRDVATKREGACRAPGRGQGQGEQDDSRPDERDASPTATTSGAKPTPRRNHPPASTAAATPVEEPTPTFVAPTDTPDPTSEPSPVDTETPAPEPAP